MNKFLVSFVLLFILSNCGNSVKSIKERELEIKERELNLKEKELELKSKMIGDTIKNNATNKTEVAYNNEFTEIESDGGTYIPEYEVAQTSHFQLTYSFEKGSDKPNCEIIFRDGFEVFILPSCEGEYFWCLRDNDNHEFGSMKLLFSKDGKSATIDVKEGQYANKYKKYLIHLKGILIRI